MSSDEVEDPGCEICGKIDEHYRETGWMCFECSEVF